MHPARILRQAVEQHRTPLIKFLGKRGSPKQSPDPTPTIHPASPTPSLPDSFVQYRSKAQNHGPLGHRASQSGSSPAPSPSSRSQQIPAPNAVFGAIGANSGRSLGSVDPPPGQYFDRSELPARFARLVWTEAEIEAVESGGATLVG